MLNSIASISVNCITANALRINDVKMATTKFGIMQTLSAIFILFNTLLSADSFFIHELQ